MSAWIVSKEHIDLLTTALVRSEVVDLGGRNATEVGRTLWAENVASIHARYPDTAQNDCDYPGPIGFTSADVQSYTFTPYAEPMSPALVLLQVRCFDYQSCEHFGWDNSLANQWLSALEDVLSPQVTPSELDAQPWGV